MRRDEARLFRSFPVCDTPPAKEARPTPDAASCALSINETPAPDVRFSSQVGSFHTGDFWLVISASLVPQTEFNQIEDHCRAPSRWFVRYLALASGKTYTDDSARCCLPRPSSRRRSHARSHILRQTHSRPAGRCGRIRYLIYFARFNSLCRPSDELLDFVA